MIDTDTRKVQILHIAEGIGVDLHTFFMMCYMWRFQKRETVENDYILFIKLGIIPLYVVDFLKEVNRETQRDGPPCEETTSNGTAPSQAQKPRW